MPKGKPAVQMVAFDTLRETLSEIVAQIMPPATPAPASPAEIEPTFTLRGQDMLAPEIVEAWADALLKVRCGSRDHKIAEAQAIALRMRAWQAEHGRKIPD